jgi:hypothetical protein
MQQLSYLPGTVQRLSIHFLEKSTAIFYATVDRLKPNQSTWYSKVQLISSPYHLAFHKTQQNFGHGYCCAMGLMSFSPYNL